MVKVSTASSLSSRAVILPSTTYFQSGLTLSLSLSLPLVLAKGSTSFLVSWPSFLVSCALLKLGRTSARERKSRPPQRNTRCMAQTPWIYAPEARTTSPAWYSILEVGRPQAKRVPPLRAVRHENRRFPHFPSLYARTHGGAHQLP